MTNCIGTAICILYKQSYGIGARCREHMCGRSATRGVACPECTIAKCPVPVTCCKNIISAYSEISGVFSTGAVIGKVNNRCRIYKYNGYSAHIGRWCRTVSVLQGNQCIIVGTGRWRNVKGVWRNRNSGKCSI